MLSKEIKTVTDTKGSGIGYSSDGGSFFTINSSGNAGEASTCREIFSDYFHKSTATIGFTKTNLNIKKVNEFFGIIEKKLKFKKADCVVFYPTNNKNIVYVSVPKFWREDNARRQLFTLFLRAAAVYYKDNFEQALTSYTLANKIKPLITRFLAGNIYPIKDFSGGIVDRYSSADGRSINLAFVKNVKKVPVVDRVLTFALKY